MAKSAGTRAIQTLLGAGVEHTVHTYKLEERALAPVAAADSYGERVALAVGTDPERIYKTLVADASGEAVVAIVPVSGRLGLKQLARAAGTKKAEMADPARAERLTGYVTGGISPFGQLRELRSFADETVELWETIFVSAGRRGLQVEVAPADLLRLSGAVVADLSI